MTYLKRLPASMPEGQVLVHNNVRAAKRLGWRGFRAWLQAPSDRVDVCGCGWAPKLGPHYRVTKVRS